MTHFLSALFTPRAVAIIGASSDPEKLGGRPVAHNIGFGFTKTLYPVNPGAKDVQGLKAYPSLEAIDADIDCAIVAVPAAAVEASVEACVRKGVKVAIIFASGFAEVNAEGARKQREIAAKARAGGLRLVGPNAMGALSLAPRFSGTFSSIHKHHGGDAWPKPGVVAIVSQSGAVGTQTIVQLRDRGVGLSRWIATGNQCDVDIADAIEFCAQDDMTKVIALYMEGATSGPRLIAALEAARRAGKPIIALKVGRSEAGVKAVQSHTASLAGEDRVYDAILSQYGVLRAKSFDQFIDFSAACATCIDLARPELGLVTNSGGIGVLMADAAADIGLATPPLSAAAREKIIKLAPFAVPGNPADTGALGVSDIKLNTDFAEVMLGDENMPAAILFFAHLGLMPRFPDEIAAAMTALREKYPDRPLAAVMNATREFICAMQDKGVLVFEDATRAVEAMGALWRARRPVVSTQPPLAPFAMPHPREGFSGEQAARRVVAAIGIHVAEDRLATSADEAALHAKSVGGRVALKIVSPDIAHKSDMGGVALGLADEAAVRAAFARVMDNAKKNAPQARVEGVMVSPMIEGGVETIVGVARDPLFGPMVMFGLGGVFVEIAKDTVLRRAPVSREDALAMIRSIKAFPLLDGARGRPKMDIEALAEAISRLSAWAAKYADEFASVEINPLIVLPKGQGVAAVDALIMPLS